MKTEIYSCEAQFRGTAEAKIALPKITGFLKQMAAAEGAWDNLIGSKTAPSKNKLRRFAAKHGAILSALDLDTETVISEAKKKSVGLVCLRLNSPAQDSFWSIAQHENHITFNAEVRCYAD